ncbi:MAG: glycoside hydrolase family 99-like domain-containing protein [Lentisphaeria bacterium]|nr:glycoside hydrolase family 99-like domain-containing protein [Lentisphaeria bacterium]
MTHSLKLLVSLLVLASGGTTTADIAWEFNGSATPAGTALELVAGKPAFVKLENVQALAPDCALEWADAPILTVRPELEIRCRFRLDEPPATPQILAMKDGEYILRVDWRKEGGHLSFFVQIEGQWEPRLRGPIVKLGVWYDVRALWTGTELHMNVNDQFYSRRRAGRTRAKDSPLQTGPISGVIDRLEIRNPGFDRATILTGLVNRDAATSAKKRFGGAAGWSGWRTLGGAICEVRKNGAASLSCPTGSSMFVSPALALDLTALPFVCLEIEAPGPGWTGHLDFMTDTGADSIAFQPLGDGRPTLVPGVGSQSWIGTLRRLALSFSGGKGTVVVKQLALADRAVGTPWFYIRDFAPGRAKLRPGREETVIVAVKNLGGEAENVRLRLTVPEGLEILGEEEMIIPYMGLNDFDMGTWRVKAERVGIFTVTVSISSANAPTRRQSLNLLFEPLPLLPLGVGLPKPIPAQSDYTGLMHYCALWKEGTHYGWKRIEPWPGRRPAIGWYDEGTPEVADWHIKYALEHGVNAFIYCWYRAHYEPEIEHTLGHAIHEGLFNAKYRDLFQFCIMWENGCAKGVKDQADLMNNLLPFWIKNYFTHPSYLKIGNMPVLFVWRPRRLFPQLGGTEGTRKAFDAMRARCREEGFAGLRIIACMNGPDDNFGKQIQESGWDAVSGYHLRPSGVSNAGVDPDGIPFQNYTDVLSRYKKTWEKRDECTGTVPDIPNVVMGWDPRPWTKARRGGYIADPKTKNFESACREAKALIDAKPAGRWDSGLVVFDNWTEFGEGHYIEPTSGLGFSFLNAIKRVFCKNWAPEALTDIIPEDLGMPPPQKRYEEVRAGFGDRMPWQPRRITGDLLADWQFEKVVNGNYLDSTTNDNRLPTGGTTLEPGRGGQTLRCGAGGATCTAPAPFFPPSGITIALWCKPEQPAQSDRWMLNTVATANSGYRLGLGGGHPVWQVPKESWSHGLRGPKALPVGKWSHVAATFDNRTMRLYVDGAEVGTLERSGFINPGREVTLGGYSASLDRARFLGWLDNVRIYRRVLAPAEITALARRE